MTMPRIFINGEPVNVCPIPNRPHLCDITEVEDVDFVELEPIKDNEETQRNN